LPPHLLAHVVDRAATDDGIRPGEIDVLKDAEARGAFGYESMALDSLAGDDHHLAIFHLADEFSIDDVERAGLGGEHPSLAELAQHQRPDAMRRADTVHLFVGAPHEGIGAFDLEHRLDIFLDEMMFLAAGHE